jgi:hypothetical protein
VSSSDDEDITGALAWLKLMNAQKRASKLIPANMVPTKHLKS